MADTIEIVQGTATTIEIAGLQGPQGPAGASQADVLTQQGDMLYRSTVAARLPIGTAGQILKVNAGGTAPEWGAAPASGVSSVAGRSGDVTLAKADVGLGNVDNTSDANKPVSTATQTALDGKAASSHTHGNLTNDGKIGSTAGLPLKTGTAGVVEAGSFGTSAGTFCEGNDARLSDARTPSSTLAHAASHAAGASDELFNQSLDTTDTVQFGAVGIGAAASGKKLNILGSSDTSAQVVIKGAQWFGSVDGNQGVLYQGDVAGKIKVVALNSAFSEYKTLELVSNGDTFTFPLNGGKLALESDTGNAIAASYTGIGDNETFSDSVTIIADTAGTAGNNISLAFDGVDDVDTVLAAWNSANPSNTVTLDSGDGSQVPDNGDALTLSGGVDAIFAAKGSITTSGLTQATARLIGRTSSGVGAPEELSASDVRSFLNVADGAEVNVNADWNASSGDAQILNKPTLGTAAAAATTDFAAASHTHAASAITSGTLDVARIPTGSTSTTVALGNHSHELTSLAATGATNGHVLTANGSGGVTFAAASGGIGGSTGSTSQAILRASGTGGSTAQSSDLVIDDYTSSTQGNVTIAPRSVSFSATIAASDDFVTATGHTFANGDQVVFTSLTGGAGLTANIRYFVRDAATNVFKVATTVSGAAVDVTTNYTAATVERIAAVVITTRNVAPFIVGPKPDGTALGGDARGLRAINIAMSRDASTEVASGDDSIAIGTRSSSSGLRGVAVGRLARANGSTSSTAIGQTTNASGQQATAIGTEAGATALASTAIGNAVVASAQDAVAIGSYDANDTGAIATAIRCVGLNAIANMRGMLATRPFNAVYWGGQTTSDTANVELNLDAAATNRMVIAANTAVIADIFLIARRTDNTKFLSARRWVAIRRDGSNNTALIGAVQTIGTDQSEGSPTWTFTIDADDTASVESLRVRVTGAASETVNWRVCAIYRVVA